jgi:hypothetical protein
MDGFPGPRLGDSGVDGLLHVANSGYALGWPLQVGRMVPILVGGLFVVLGVLMPRIRSTSSWAVERPGP